MNDEDIPADLCLPLCLFSTQTLPFTIKVFLGFKKSVRSQCQLVKSMNIRFKTSEKTLIEFNCGCHAITAITNPWSHQRTFTSVDMTQVFNELNQLLMLCSKLGACYIYFRMRHLLYVEHSVSHFHNMTETKCIFNDIYLEQNNNYQPVMLQHHTYYHVPELYLGTLLSMGFCFSL